MSVKARPVQSSVQRAAAFALVGSLSLVAPIAGALSAVPFALIAVAGRLVSEGRVFELFARPSDRIDEELRGLVGFALAATALALLTSLFNLSASVFVATVFIVGYGNFVEQLVCEKRDTPFRRAVGFGIGGSLAAVAGGVAAMTIGPDRFGLAVLVFLAVTGALVGALLRNILASRDDPLVMVVVASFLWLFTTVELSVGALELGGALLIASGFGYLSWLTGTASVSGMLAGIISGLLTIVLGGFGWFVVLITFFGLGGFASQYRYDDKRELGVAEANEGARGSANVLSNAAVALGAVIGFGAADQLAIAPLVFALAFAGSLATAMSDTFSSELGVLLGRPVLITTLEPVSPGTDGGITVRGTLVGAVGAAIIAGIATILLGVGVAGGILVLLAGTIGMLVDSLLGATLEGRVIGNQSVNFLATLAGALLCAVLAAGFGLI